MKVTLIGIDLAKSVFQVCGVNRAGKPVFNRQVRRNKLMALLIQHPEATIAINQVAQNKWREFRITIAQAKLRPRVPQSRTGVVKSE